MQGASSPLTDWINSDVKTANTVSIIMIIFAAWAGIEAISNVAGIAIHLKPVWLLTSIQMTLKEPTTE